MINAIAIDDDPPALSILETFSGKIDFISLQKSFNKPSETLKYLHKFAVSLLFLDIQMPSLSEIDLYKSIQQDTMVIFTTAYCEYAVECFNLNAVDFLLKSFTFERFEKAVNNAWDYYNFSHPASTEEQHHFIRADYGLLKINLADILYIEVLDDYLKIHLQNQKTVVTQMTMKAMIEKLSEKDFVRVHRSFIVPFNRILHVRNKVIHLQDKEIPVRNSFEEGFF